MYSNSLENQAKTHSICIQTPLEINWKCIEIHSKSMEPHSKMHSKCMQFPLKINWKCIAIHSKSMDGRWDVVWALGAYLAVGMLV